MTLLVQSPLLHGSDAIELAAGRWAKRLLPVGQVEYKGRVLNFDRPYLEGLAKAFSANAYDQVPFQLADAGNAHTNDPERTRGWVTGMDVADDGLWVTVETTEAGNQVLRSNPRLGVSARIVEDYARSDGKYYPVAIQHVLGTLDPRIPELGDWQPVGMSNGGFKADMIIDLSACEWYGEPGYGELDFADGGGGRHPLSGGIRKLARRLASRHPMTGAAEHASRAADALDGGDANLALAYLDAAHGAVPGDGSTQSDREITTQIAKVQADTGQQVTDQQIPDGDLDAGRVDGDKMTRPKSATDYANDGDSTGTDSNGLTARGQAIYKKLTGKGVAPKVAMAMAKRAQNAQPGKQFAGDGGGYEFAEPMAGAYQALELAHQQAAQREIEDARDAQRLARRRTGTGVTEDRLGAAMARIGRGTYTPGTGQRALGFANDATDAVDRAAGQAGGWTYSACTCTEDGIPAMTRYHTIGCPEAEITPDMSGEVARSGELPSLSAEPAADANGNYWADQYGLPAGMTTLVQASTGERLLNLSEGGFETGHRQERILPQRTIRFGDPGGPDGDPDGQEMTAGSAEYVRGLAETMGLASPTAGQARERAAQRQAQAGRPAARYRTWGEMMDRDPAVRQRAEQIKGEGRLPEPAAGPAEFSNTYADGSYGDGVRLPGELPRYTLG